MEETQTTNKRNYDAQTIMNEQQFKSRNETNETDAHIFDMEGQMRPILDLQPNNNNNNNLSNQSIQMNEKEISHTSTNKHTNNLLLRYETQKMDVNKRNLLLLSDEDAFAESLNQKEIGLYLCICFCVCVYVCVFECCVYCILFRNFLSLLFVVVGRQEAAGIKTNINKSVLNTEHLLSALGLPTNDIPDGFDVLCISKCASQITSKLIDGVIPQHNWNEVRLYLFCFMFVCLCLLCLFYLFISYFIMFVCFVCFLF
jgi:hypothetical protein